MTYYISRFKYTQEKPRVAMSFDTDIETQYTPSTPTVEDADSRELAGSCVSDSCDEE